MSCKSPMALRRSLQDVVPLQLLQDGQQLPHRGVSAAGLPLVQHQPAVGVPKSLEVLDLQVG